MCNLFLFTLFMLLHALLLNYALGSQSKRVLNGKSVHIMSIHGHTYMFLPHYGVNTESLPLVRQVLDVAMRSISLSNHLAYTDYRQEFIYGQSVKLPNKAVSSPYQLAKAEL